MLAPNNSHEFAMQLSKSVREALTAWSTENNIYVHSFQFDLESRGAIIKIEYMSRNIDEACKYTLELQIPD